MTGTITSSILTRLDPDEIMSKYTSSLPENPINFPFISRYLNFINNYKDGIRLERLLVTFSELDLDPDLLSFFSHGYFFSNKIPRQLIKLAKLPRLFVNIIIKTCFKSTSS